MAGYHQIVLLFFLLFANGAVSSQSASNSSSSASTSNLTKRDADLDAAEANGKLEIIKQIKKVNDDGSYTIGYEADDGSFKIESRDVLGNIKGTYGYIDDNGDIKRVSYSSSNATEGITSTSEPISVVQRIPSKANVTRSTPTTRRPSYVSTTGSPTSTSGAVQSIPRRRITMSTTTTSAPTTTEKYSQFIKDALSASKLSSGVTSTPTTVLYESSTPARLLAQSKPLVRGTQSTQKVTTSEGQLLRPEVLLKPTDMPLYRRLPIKTTLLDEDTKPVTEEPEVERSNVLRRQLPAVNRDEKVFDARQHVLNVQQGAGDDTVDVYSASVTTGSPRPLFTTLRPRLVTTTVNPLLPRGTPTIRYPTYQRAPVTRAPQTPAPTTEYPQESSTEPSVTVRPVVQIPANAGSANAEEPIRQQYVELRHPYHRGAILVPVNHIPRRPVAEDQIQYQQIQPLQGDPSEQEPVYQYRRVPKFRPIPVHVDENGFIREYSTPNPYTVQRPVTIAPVHVQDLRQQQQEQQQQQPYISQNDIINEVDSIKPPVSTRDFQKLLEQLILRQSRLEKISALTNPHFFRQRPQYQEVYQQPQQHLQPHHPHPNQVQFVPRTQTQTAQPQQQHPVIVRPAPQPLDEHPYNQYAPVTFTPAPARSGNQPNYHPTKRMVRPAPVHLNHNQHLHQEQSDDEYLPAPVREMLLLRMLQLAINPSLPLDAMDNIESATTPLPQKNVVRNAVRNVEILGEAEDDKRPSRTKRYKQVEFDYYD